MAPRSCHGASALERGEAPDERVRRLAPHHVVYRSRGGDDSESNLVSLCAAHHLHGVHRGFIRVKRNCWRAAWGGTAPFGFGMLRTTVSHDALRLLARHGTGLVNIGEDGTRFYASMPFGADASDWRAARPARGPTLRNACASRA